MQALANNGVAFDPSLVVYHEITMGNTYAVMKDFAQSRKDYSGVFAFSDLVALEAIYAMQEVGMAGRAVNIILNKIKGEVEKEYYQEVFDTVLIK